MLHNDNDKNLKAVNIIASKTALAFPIVLPKELYTNDIRVNAVTFVYTAIDLNQFQCAKTTEEGAWPIVPLTTGYIVVISKVSIQSAHASS